MPVAEIEQLETDVAAFKHAFNATYADRDRMLAHLGGRRTLGGSAAETQPRCG